VEYQRGRTLPVPPQRGQLPEPPQVTHLLVAHVPVFPRPPQAKHRVFPLHAPHTSSLPINPSALHDGPDELPAPYCASHTWRSSRRWAPGPASDLTNSTLCHRLAAAATDPATSATGPRRPHPTVRDAARPGRSPPTRTHHLRAVIERVSHKLRHHSPSARRGEPPQLGAPLGIAPTPTSVPRVDAEGLLTEGRKEPPLTWPMSPVTDTGGTLRS
jgi:hypothetical protein